MTDQQLFVDLLARNKVRVYSPKPDNDDPTQTIFEIDNGSEKVDTFSHCFCEFRFNADGSLACIRYGY